MAKMTSEERKWRAEEDANTMARYEEIMSDSSRRNAAVKAARERAEDLNKRAATMSRVAGTRSTRKK